MKELTDEQRQRVATLIGSLPPTALSQLITSLATMLQHQNGAAARRQFSPRLLEDA